MQQHEKTRNAFPKAVICFQPLTQQSVTKRTMPARQIAKFQPLTQQSVTKRAMSALRNGRCPRYKTGNARVTESAYDVFRLSFFPGCRRISSLAFRGICAKPHIYVKKICRPFHGRNFLKKNPIGDCYKIYSENSSNGLPVARSIQANFPPCKSTNEWGEFSLGSDTEPQFK